MKIKDIQDAIKADKRFTFTNVKIHWLDHERGDICMNNHFPSIENQPVNSSLDIKEISVYEQPKYDPCRLLKKGDEVKVKMYNGRYPIPKLHKQEVSRGSFKVIENEIDGCVKVTNVSGTFTLPICYIELVTPVEEMEQEPHFFISDEFEQLPYFCLYFGTKQNKELVAGLDKKYYTLEAAEAERDRLNAEYRKEQNNG